MEIKLKPMCSFLISTQVLEVSIVEADSHRISHCKYTGPQNKLNVTLGFALVNFVLRL